MTKVWRRSFWIGIGLGLSAIAAGNLPARNFVESYRVSGSSAQGPVEIPNALGLCEVLAHGEGEIRIAVQADLRELSGYQNFFQTADLNAGIRVEVDDRGEVGLIVGTGDPNTYAGITAEGIVSPGPILVDVLVTGKGQISVRDSSERWTGTTLHIDPSCSRLLVGMGFNQERAFKGAVTATFIAGYSNPLVPHGRLLTTVGMLILFLSFVGFAARRTGGDSSRNWRGQTSDDADGPEDDEEAFDLLAESQ